MGVDGFIKKWGILGPGLLISEVIQRAPSYPGDAELAKKLGEMVADLEDALEGREIM